MILIGRGRQRVRRGIVVTTTAALVCAILVVPQVAHAASTAPAITRVAVVDQDSVLAVNSDGTELAYTNLTGGHHELYRFDKVAGSSQSITGSSDGDVTAVAIDGSGSEIAFVSDATDLDASGAALVSGTPQAYVAQLSGGSSTLTRLPLPAGDTTGAGEVAISKDGSLVAYGDGAHVQLWRSGQPLTGVNVTPSGATSAIAHRVTLSADGSTLAAVVDDGSGTGRLVLTELANGMQATMPVAVDLRSPAALTGDGSTVIAAPAAQDYLLSWAWRGGGTPIDIDSWGSSIAGYPSVSADGHFIAQSWKMSDEDGYLVPVEIGGTDHVLVSVDDSDYQTPTTGFGSNSTLAESRPQLSADGLTVAFRSNAQLAGQSGPAPAGQTVLYLAKLHDENAPTLGGYDEDLAVDDVQPTSVALTLPRARDDLAVVREAVTANGTPATDTGANPDQYTVAGLAAGTKYVFTVTAYDQSGHASNPESVTVWTPKPSVSGSFATRPVSGLPAGTPGVGVQVDDLASPPAISGNGRYVAYVAAPIAGYDTGGDPLDAAGNDLSDPATQAADDQVYLTDTQTGTTTLVTHPAGSADPASSAAPNSVTISADGRYVGYVASGTDLAPGVTGTDPHVYVYDRTTGASSYVATPDALFASGDNGPDNGPPVPLLRMSDDGSRLLVLTAGTDVFGRGEPCVIDWQTGSNWPIDSEDAQLFFDGAALSGNGATVAISGGNGDMEITSIYDVASRTEIHSFAVGGAPVGFNDAGTLLRLDNSRDPGQGDASNVNAEWDKATPDTLTYFGGPELVAAAGDGVHAGFYAYDSDNEEDDVFLGAFPDGAPEKIGTGWEPVLDADGSAVAYVDEVDDATGYHDAVFVAHAGDATAPSWPAGAALQTTDATTTSVHLSWPPASDNVGVTSYVLTQDGKPLATLGGSVTSYDVTGLSAGTSYTFTVVAKDAVGNPSAALTATAATLSTGITPGTDPLIAQAQPGGLVTLSWDPAAGTPGGYRILRDDGNGMAKVVDVAAGATSYTDTGRLASTSYTYRVDVLDTTGTAGPWTKTASVTTPAIAIDKATATMPYLTGTAVATLGGQVGLRVTGEPNRQAAARIDYWTHASPTDRPTPQTATVPLTADPDQPGTYTGSWTIPEGAGGLTAVTGVLSDGVAAHDATAVAAGLPVEVSGALAITVDAPPTGSLTGSQLDISGPGFETVVPVDAPGLFTVPVPAGTGYDARLETSGYAVLADVTRDVAAGLTTTAELQPTFDASLVVTVAKADGTTGGTTVTITDSAGNPLGQQDIPVGTSTATFTGLAAGDFVTVTSTLDNLNEPLFMQAQGSRYLIGGENDVTLTHVALPTGTISGTVTSTDGNAAVAGARVHVSVAIADGRSVTYDQTTDAGGQYSLVAAAGQATITASAAGYFGDTRQVAVTAGDTAAGDLQLEPQAALTVHVLPPAGEPAGGVTVTLSDSNNATIDTQIIPDGQTDATLPKLHRGASYTITVITDHPSRPIQSYSGPVTIDSYDMTVTVQEQDLPSATLTGAITSQADHAPVAGASVQVHEVVDNRPWTFAVTTDSEGRYSMSVYAGTVAVLVVASGYGHGSGTATLDSGRIVTYDAALVPVPDFTSGTVGWSGGLPMLNWAQPAGVQSVGCPDAVATTSIVGQMWGGGIPGQGYFGDWTYDTYLMPETAPGSGVYRGVLPPQYPMHGPVNITTSVSCLPQQLMTPDTGPAGTTVRAIGSGFAAATGVRFGSVPATSFAVYGDGLLQAVAPAGSGTVPVVVETPSGSVTLGQYSYGDTVAPALEPALAAQRGATVAVGPHAGVARIAPMDVTLTGILAWLYSKGPSVLSGLLNLRNGINGFLNDLHPTCKDTEQAVIDALSALVSPLVKPIVEAALPTVEEGLAAVFAETGPGLLVILALAPIALNLLAGKLVGALIKAAVDAWFSHLDCRDHPPGPREPQGPDTLIDPSGTVFDTNGNPVAGATVTLLRADTADGPFVPMDETDPGIEPAVNPEITAGDGVFHWDVRSGYYEIKASKPGCSVPADPSASDAVTGPYPVPPPQVGLTVTLACPDEAPPPVPVIDQLSESHGPPAGGTQVLITGSGFTPSSTVTFGKTTAASVTYLSPTALSVTAPAGSGPEDVVVHTKGGDSAAAPFFYGNSPTVTELSTSTGPATGGTRVTITGTGFTGAALVGFGGAPGTDLKVLSDTQLQVTTPAQLPGAVPVEVVTPAGANQSTTEFTFVRGVVQLRVTSTPTAPVYGQDVTLTIGTSPARPGSVLTATEGSTTLGTGTAGNDGTARITLAGLHAGAHSLTVSYPGDDQTLSATGSTAVTVSKAATELTLDPVVPPLDSIHTTSELIAYLRALVRYLRHPTITVELTRATDGAPIGGASVRIETRAGLVCVATTGATGMVTCDVPRRMQMLVLFGQVQGSYPGSNDYLPAQAGGTRTGRQEDGPNG